MICINNAKIYANLYNDGIKSLNSERPFFDGKVEVVEDNGVYKMSVNLECKQSPYGYAKTLNSQNGAYIDIKLDDNIDGILSRVQYSPFWSRPCFEKDMTKLPDNIQDMLIKCNNKYISILPICHSDFNTTICAADDKSTVRVSLAKYYEGAIALDGVFAVISISDNPYDAVNKAYRYACNNYLITTKLRCEKQLNQIYNGIGWCTWNAFYHDVTEEQIFKKLDEFKTKNIPIKWMIIDDGWMQFSKNNELMITSFFEDKVKFPHGLKGCIEKAKKEYGIKAVGVWHAITAYWFGIEKDSELYNTQKQNLTQVNQGWYIPNAEKAYDFFNEWHSYLKSQGVDFVKVDGQGNSAEFLRGKKDCIKRCIQTQLAIEKSVADNFNGNMLNCMGMDNINVQSRPFTALTRSSDDFYPQKPQTFTNHIMQNTYNAVFQGQLFYCDFDMWWSNEITAKRSSILRAVSGGPIYLSDKPGDSNSEYILPLLDDDGNIKRCDNCALPMPDCLFKSPEDNVLKIYNKINDEYIIAVFNLSDNEKSVKLSINPFATDDKYIAYSYFGKKYYDADIEVNIKGNDVEIFNYYKINGEEICVGNMQKCVSIGGTEKFKIQNIFITR